MARLTNGSSDYLVTAASIDLSAAGTGNLSIAMLMWWDAFANNDNLAMELSVNHNVNTGAFIINPNESSLSKFAFGQGGVSGSYRNASFPRPSAAAWHYYLLVFSTTDASTNKAYVDGVSQTMTVGTNDGGASWASSQPLYVMSRAGSALFGAGRIAKIAIWKNDQSANAATLAAGTNPTSVASSDLLYYWRIAGTVSPEPEGNTGTPALTVSGATYTTDPAEGAGPTLPWMPVTRVVAGAQSVVLASGFTPPNHTS